MSDPVTMIMPMAGRGSRFAAEGETLPKPLIELHEQPFFYWATRGIIDVLPEVQLIYVVLQEHVENFSIDKAVIERFPQAIVHIVPQLTSGALETAMLGLQNISKQSHIIINDCDHAFVYPQIKEACCALSNGTDGFLSHFHSTAPHFSYAQYDSAGWLLQTAEKKVISDSAIAGIYGFKNREVLETAAKIYQGDCPYPELFISGVYNTMVAMTKKVKGFDLSRHVAFGTPEEFRTAVGQLPELYGS